MRKLKLPTKFRISKLAPTTNRLESYTYFRIILKRHPWNIKTEQVPRLVGAYQIDLLRFGIELITNVWGVRLRLT